MDIVGLPGRGGDCKFGKMVRGLTEPRVSVMPDTWKEQLQEARAEWRRRQPKAH